MHTTQLEKLLGLTIPFIFGAGDCIMEVYDHSDFEIEYKEDRSPLTLADRSAHSILSNKLQEIGYPILSEEAPDISWEVRKEWKQFWLVDPLDGTKEFINRNGEFTVNIALMERNQPILGMIYLPVLKDLYFAAKGLGSFLFSRNTNKVLPNNGSEWIKRSQRLKNTNPTKVVRVLGSRSHPSESMKGFLEDTRKVHKDVNLIAAGSSLKFGLIAEGKAELYPRFGPTMEWDIAAGDIIVKEAGGSIFKMDGSTLSYNKSDLRNPWFIVKSGLIFPQRTHLQVNLMKGRMIVSWPIKIYWSARF